MNVTEFFAYLLGSDATRDLGLQLDAVYSLRTCLDDQEQELVDDQEQELVDA
jgi:hypothetical protein